MASLAPTIGDALADLGASALNLLGSWAVISVAAAFVIVRLFRARARANDRLAADGRREDWAQAAGTSGTEGAETPGADRAQP